MQDAATEELLPSRRVHFVEPIPGFEGEDEFVLAAIDQHGLLYSLRSERNPELRFVLAQPETFFDDYHPETSLSADVDPATLFVLLTIEAGLQDATANLRAPIAVSLSTGAAVQLLLEDESLPMQRRLLDAVPAGQ